MTVGDRTMGYHLAKFGLSLNPKPWTFPYLEYTKNQP